MDRELDAVLSAQSLAHDTAIQPPPPHPPAADARTSSWVTAILPLPLIVARLFVLLARPALPLVTLPTTSAVPSLGDLHGLYGLCCLPLPTCSDLGDLWVARLPVLHSILRGIDGTSKIMIVLYDTLDEQEGGR